MLLFRSEEHLDRWLADGHPKGERMTLDRQWELAVRWFAGRHLPGWHKRNADEAAEVFSSVGLTSDFWRLS
jgi:hypothetical protein